MAKKFSIGSDKSCDIVLADSSVSPRHAELTYESGQLLIVAADPAKKPVLLRRGEKKTVTSEHLFHGDTVQIGELSLTSEELIDAARHKDPTFIAPLLHTQRAVETIKTPKPPGRWRKHLKNKWLIAAAVLVVTALVLKSDHDRAVGELEFYEDGVERIQSRIRDPLHDASSITALRGQLRMYRDETFLLSDRWIKSRKTSLLEYMGKVDEELKPVEEKLTGKKS